MAQSDKDILISRVVDDEATAEDWGALRELAERDPAVWRELADAQYTSIGLASAVAAAIGVADGVEAPVHEHLRSRLTVRAGAAARWGGWLVAAAVALAWFGGVPGDRPGQSPAYPVAGANLGPPSVSEAFRRYVDLGKQSGQVVQEAPQLLLVETRRAPGGRGYEVLYVRQVLERAVVDDLYGLGQDETGHAVRVRLEGAPVPADPM